MNHNVDTILRSLPLRSGLVAIALALGGCAPDADPSPPLSAEAPHLAPASADAGDDDDEPTVFLAPGEITVRWGFGDLDLPAACAARGVASVRLEVGLDAPLVVACSEGSHRYERLPAGMYSVGVVLLDAAGAVAGEHYEAVVLSSGGSAAVTTTF